MKKIVIMVTVPVVLETWLKGQPKFLSQYYDIEIIRSDSIDTFETNSIDIAIVNKIDSVTKLSLITGLNGIVAIGIGDIYKNTQINKNIMLNLSKEFKIVQPSIFKDNQAFLFASKKYHPQADIILQQSQMLPKQTYYNSDIHKASFVYDNFIETLYKGYIHR